MALFVLGAEPGEVLDRLGFEDFWVLGYCAEAQPSTLGGLEQATILPIESQRIVMVLLVVPLDLHLLNQLIILSNPLRNINTHKYPRPTLPHPAIQHRHDPIARPHEPHRHGSLPTLLNHEADKGEEWVADSAFEGLAVLEDWVEAVPLDCLCEWEEQAATVVSFCVVL